MKTKRKEPRTPWKAIWRFTFTSLEEVVANIRAAEAARRKK